MAFSRMPARLRTLLTTFVVLVLAAPGLTAADTPAAPTPMPATPLYGAVAISDTNLAYGWAKNSSNRADAEILALQYCKANASDCHIALSGHDICFAVAISKPDAGWSVQTNADAKLASDTAVANCTAGKYKACEVAVTMCSNGS